MNRWKKTRLSSGKTLSRTVVFLLTFTLLAIGLTVGVAAKYIFSGAFSDRAGVYGLGRVDLAVKEHKFSLNGNGVYEKSDEPQNIGNTYMVLPGVDMLKAPFIEIDLTNAAADLQYNLYLKVTETNWPKDSTVTYTLITKASVGADGYYWALENDGLYILYQGEKPAVFAKGDLHQYSATPGEDTSIRILTDDKLYVSERYAGGGEFLLEFEAQLRQIQIKETD